MENEKIVLGFINNSVWANIDAIITIISSIGIFSVIMFFLKDKIDFYLKKYIYVRNDFILICGLNENNRFYIDSEIDNGNKKIIVIEQNKDNLYIKKYKDKGVLIEVGEPTDIDFIKSLKIKKSKHILISTGKDITNLEIVTQILQIDNNLNLYVNIEDRQLRHFHKEQGIFGNSSIRMYSFFEEAARDLFNKFDIDGNENTNINSRKHFSIAVIGNNTLSLEVIFQACILGQLPNENILKIYCIDKNKDEFKQNIELLYTQINQIKTISFEYLPLDMASKDFYESDFWHDNMTNVIICLENEQKNLNIASNLAEITYKDKIAENKLKTNILISMFNDYNLSKKIKSNNTVFKNFFTFGSKNEINHKNIIINEERDIQAKYVNYIYNNINPELLDYESYLYKYTEIEIEKNIDINKEWKKLSYFKQESNRAVADQIKTKLKFLGLRIEKSKDNLKDLYLDNKSLFESYADDKLNYILAKNEHQRWNTFHFLNGFEKIEIIHKDKKRELKNIHELKKEHMCLILFEEFKNKKEQFKENGFKEGEFEGYDFLINAHIPFIMAKSGYRICPIVNN